MSLLLLLWLVSALPVEAGDGAAATSPANIPGDYTTGEHSGRESSQTVSEQHLRIPNAAYGERDRLQYQLGELGCKHKRLENEIMMRRSCLVNYDATKGGSNYAEALTKYAKTLSDMADVATQMRDVCLQMARQQEAEVMPPGGGRGHTGCSSSSSAQSGSAEETTGRGAAPVPSEWAPAGFHPAHATVGFWVCDASVGSWAWVPGGLQPVEQVWAQQQAGCGSVAGSCGPQHGMEYVCPNNGIIAPTELGTTGGDAEGVRVSRSLPMRKEDVNAEVSQCGMRASAAPFVPVPSLNREIVVPEPLCHYPQEHPSGPGVHKLADVETALRAMDLSASFPFEDLSKGTAAERSSNGERGQHVETPTTAATSATASKTDSTSGSECGETTTVRPTVSPTPNAAPTPTNGAGNLRLTCVRSGNTSQDVVERRCWADEHSDASDGEGDLDGVWNFGPNKAEKEDNPEHSGTGSSSGDHAPMVHDEKPPLLSLRADKGRWNSKAGPKRGKMEGPHGNGKSAGAGGKGEAKSSGTGGAEHKATSGVFAGHEKTSAGRRGPTQERYTGILKSWNHGARDKTVRQFWQVYSACWSSKHVVGLASSACWGSSVRLRLASISIAYQF